MADIDAPTNWVSKEKVLRTFRHKYKVLEYAPCLFPVNEVILGIFMNSCMWAAVHLDKYGDQSQCVLRNMDVDLIQNVFTTTLNQVQSLQETKQAQLGCTTDKQLQAKVYVFADSILFVGGKCLEHPRSGVIWEKLIACFVTSQEHHKLHNITELVVFEWKKFPGHTTMQLLQEIQTMMENEIHVLPSNFKSRIVFMSMYIDIDWTQKNNEDNGICP